MQEMKLKFEPQLDAWASLLNPGVGSIQNRSLLEWQVKLKAELGIENERPVIVVGHQPTMFHPGVLSKFIAGSLLARKVDGLLIHLVVDHHMGECGIIEKPKMVGRHIEIEFSNIANLDNTISMRNHPRATICGNGLIASALKQAGGQNAAMQFAKATQILMEPYVDIDCTISSKELLCSSFGKHIEQLMSFETERCIKSYNNAIDQYPDCCIEKLRPNELPLWFGSRNSRMPRGLGNSSPRALLLTLLARLGVADLFIHGLGGAKYDLAMESWVRNWLNVSPCASAMISADICLPFNYQLLEEARRNYFSPNCSGNTKEELLCAINEAPRYSKVKSKAFNNLHQWLAVQNKKPSVRQFKQSRQVALKRDWPFPLYKKEQLDLLFYAISNQLSTIDSEAPKSLLVAPVN